MTNINKLSTFALTLLITGAIDSIRNLPATALSGSALVFFFIFGAIVFLIPAALVSAELTANVDEGGIYQWVRLAFGEKIAFLAIWLQWINNIFWFPTILSFIAGTAAYIIDPALAQNKFYLVSVILTTFWLLTIVNLRGIHMSAKFTSFCAIVGLIIPMSLIIGLLVVWMISGNPVQIHLTSSNWIPDLHNGDNWITLTAVMLGFAGMELSAVHIKDVKDPQKTFPRALLFSTIIILTTMILGSLAIAYIVPQENISLVNGTMQTFAYLFNAYHLNWLTPILTVLLVVGTLGGVISWVISPIKGIAQAGHHGFLPPILKKQNAHGVPQNLLITQAILVSVTCLAFLFIPSVNGCYWLLTALATQLYTLMYALMFITGLSLRKKIQQEGTGFKIPGGKLGGTIVCLAGLLGCIITVIIGFIPPAGMNVGSTLNYEIMFCLSMLAMLVPTSFFYWYYQRGQKRIEASAVALETSI